MQPQLSVVVPVYNESQTLPELARRLLSTMNGIGSPFEILFVNDGSSDGSLDILRFLSASDPRIRVINLSRNFGHQAALYAGLQRTQGEAVVLMDGDLQDPPEVIPRFVAAWRAGSEVVYAVRQRRKEGMLKRLAYISYYRLLRGLAYIPIPVDSGDFSLIDRSVVRVLCQMPERNKFLRGLRSWVGFRQSSVTYERDARFAGETKYTLQKLFKLAFDGIVSYSFVPLRLSLVLGLVAGLSSFVLALVYVILRLFTSVHMPAGFTTLAVLMLLIGGIQLLAFGLLGEYIGRIYDEVKRRPEFLERELIGFGEPIPPSVARIGGTRETSYAT